MASRPPAAGIVARASAVPPAAPQELDAFRQRFPWPASHRALGRAREWLWTFELPGEPAALWPVRSDTARANRAARLAPMHYEEADGELHGWHRTAGVRHDFVERWQWVAPTRMSAQAAISIPEPKQ